MAVKAHGEFSSLNLGALAAHELRKSDRTIEAWRLLNRLIAISKQHHGPQHKVTKYLEGKLLECKTANVGVRGHGVKLFEVLPRDGDKYVVRGPNIAAEESKVTMTVDEADVGLQPNGTPVVCRGLKYKARIFEWQDWRDSVL
jgi:hypothetical protein